MGSIKGRKMSAAHKNECPVSAGQVVKTITKYSSNFIAKVKQFANGFYLDRSIDLTFVLCCLALVLQAVFLALAGVLQ
jgi:hypothetical protein